MVNYWETFKEEKKQKIKAILLETIEPLTMHEIGVMLELKNPVTVSKYMKEINLEELGIGLKRLGTWTLYYKKPQENKAVV